MFRLKSFGEYSSQINYTIVIRTSKIRNGVVEIYTRLFIQSQMLDFHTTYKINSLQSLIVEIDGQTLDYKDFTRHCEKFKEINTQNDYDIFAVLSYKNFKI